MDATGWMLASVFSQFKYSSGMTRPELESRSERDRFGDLWFNRYLDNHGSYIELREPRTLFQETRGMISMDGSS